MPLPMEDELRMHGDNERVPVPALGWAAEYLYRVLRQVASWREGKSVSSRTGLSARVARAAEERRAPPERGALRRSRMAPAPRPWGSSVPVFRPVRASPLPAAPGASGGIPARNVQPT